MQVELDRERQVADFVPIECEFLDGENVAWAKRYVENCRVRLEVAEANDAPYARYLATEMAAYEELLARFAGPKA